MINFCYKKLVLISLFSKFDKHINQAPFSENNCSYFFFETETTLFIKDVSKKETNAQTIGELY